MTEHLVAERPAPEVLAEKVDRLEATVDLLVDAVERIEAAIDEIVAHPALYTSGWTAVGALKPGWTPAGGLKLALSGLIDDVKGGRRLTSRTASEAS